MIDITALATMMGNLSFEQALIVLQPLVMFVVGMLVYSMFIFKFYKFISRKDIFRIRDGSNRTAFATVAYVLKYIFLFPIAAFAWFFVIAVLLAMLSQTLGMAEIFLISMSITTCIRLTAYYNEDLSENLANLIPFSMLALFLTDISSVSTAVPFQVWYQFPSVMFTLVYYFGFLVVLELWIRTIYNLKTKGSKRPVERSDAAFPPGWKGELV